MQADYLLLGSLVALYTTISRLSFAYIPCPEHLKPKNNKDKKTKEYFDYYGNYISMYHAISSLLLTAFVLVTEDFAYNAPTTFIMKVAIYNSLAYFTSDMFISIYFGYMSVPLALHHIGSIICTATVFYTQTGGAEVAVGILLAESSNPCNLTRELLKHFNKDKSSLYLLMSAGFISSFVIARFFILPIFLVKFYPSNSLLLIKIMFGFVWFVSWHWLFIIVNFGIKALRDAFAGDNKSGKPNVWDVAYALISKIRKNKPFMAAYYAGTAFLSFGTLYLAHGKS
jgi:hypothetical protein